MFIIYIITHILIVIFVSVVKYYCTLPYAQESWTEHRHLCLLSTRIIDGTSSSDRTSSSKIYEKTEDQTQSTTSMEGPPPSMEGIERKPSALKRRIAPNAGLVVSAEAHSHWVDAYQKKAVNNCPGIKSTASLGWNRCLRMRTQTKQL